VLQKPQRTYTVCDAVSFVMSGCPRPPIPGPWAVPDVARCLQSAANAEQSAMRSRDCGVYLLLHLSARRACAEMRCRYAAPAHWRSAGGANCETFRIHSLISKRTIHIPNEGGWTRGQGLSLRRCDCVAFEHRLKSRYTEFRD